jgi:putative DNA primase/helicase
MKKPTSSKKSALEYARRGWAILPLHTVKNGICSCIQEASCKRPGKHPCTINGVKDATTDRGEINTWWKKWSDANIGIATGSISGFFALDVDGKAGKASLEALQAKYGRLPMTMTVKTGHGRHLYFRCDGVQIRNSVASLGDGLDVRGNGGYVVGAGSVHNSGITYRFIAGGAADDIKVARAPKWLLGLVTRKTAADSEAALANIVPVPAAKLDRARAFADAARHRELARVTKAPNHQRNNALNQAAFKLGQLVPYGILDEQAVAADLAQAALQIGLEADEIQPTVASGLNAGRKHPRELPFSPAHAQIETVEPPQKRIDELACQLARCGETDTDNAQRFAQRFGPTAIHTPGMGWLVFDGRRWCPDSLNKVVELAKETARLIAQEAEHLSDDTARARRKAFSVQSLNKGSLDRMLDLAKSLLAVKDECLDADPWALNVENGTIDLRTGHLEKHDPRDLLTKVAPVQADRTAKCPIFKKFLKRITADDPDLASYIQRAVGYSLSGDTTEQVFFFVYGRTGQNGKSTLVNLIREMFRDYGLHTQTESLLVKQYDNNIPADLARLRGARMVTAIEANVNRHLDEAKIKAMTGGEPIVARFMRQNFFQFAPTFKLWLVANDQPRVRGTDQAFWRRVRVIPLEVSIPPSERDPQLPSKLQEEWPGILAWAVRGCLKRQKIGLTEPPAVRAASQGWQKQMDHLKAFVESELIITLGMKIASSRLLDFYKKWCVQNGETSLSVQDFKMQLQTAHNITHKRIKGHSWWCDIQLR